jgi:hypothetical protein
MFVSGWQEQAGLRVSFGGPTMFLVLMLGKLPQ